ncbi:MAG: PcfJ domain-containing protein [Microscillaceae bacterium]|nr:PcfJ domain-containing protein [Microscillaceae bacterium]
MGKLSKLQQKKLDQLRIQQSYLESLQKGKKMYKNPAMILNEIYEGNIKYWHIPTESGLNRIGVLFQQVWNDQNNLPQKQSFYELLLKLVQNRSERLLEDAEVVGGLKILSENQDKSIRELKTWKPKTYNRRKQFGQLLRHLFAKYKVPEFMDQAFYYPNDYANTTDWFIHIGQGGNIRTASGLPIQLSKKMAHYFLQTPAHYSIYEALRYGQVLGLGGTAKLADYLIKTRLGNVYDCNYREAFWTTVVQFLINHTPDNLSRIHDIVEYIHYQKYENRRIFVGRGQTEELGPTQPDFSMKGRTLNSLLKATQEWQKEMRIWSQELNQETWEPIEIPDFELTLDEGTLQHKHYKIRQLLTGNELYHEGKAMSHCVGGYVSSCINKECSIWAMTVDDFLTGKKKLITIELDDKGVIQQAKAKFNAQPSEEAWQVLALWAERHNLKIPAKSNY